MTAGYEDEGAESTPEPGKGAGGEGQSDRRIRARGAIVYRASLGGVCRILEDHVGMLRFDEAKNEVVLVDEPPWQRDDASIPRLFDRRESYLCARWIEEEIGETVSHSTVVDAASIVAGFKSRRIDSVRDAARLVRWDGVARLSGLAALLGLDVSRSDAVASWLVSVARRALSPGCPLEEILVVEGSRLVRENVRALLYLVPDDLSLDAGLDIDTRSSACHRPIAGRMLLVLSDVVEASPYAMDMLASFLGRCSDGRDAPERRCGCAVVSSGEMDRYPPRFVSARSVGLPNRAELLEHRAQYLAEAVELVYARPAPTSSSPSTPLGQCDPWEPLVRRYLATKWDTIKRVGFLATSAVLRDAIKMPAHLQQRSHDMRVARILHEVGFRRPEGGGKVRTSEGLRIRAWLPPENLDSSVAADGILTDELTDDRNEDCLEVPNLFVQKKVGTPNDAKTALSAQPLTHFSTGLGSRLGSRLGGEVNIEDSREKQK